VTNDDDTNDSKISINTNGGDLAGRDIDKRQGGVFVENSTVEGDVIGGDKVGGDKVLGDKHTTIVQPLPSPALHQLRAPVSDFVGREHEIDQLVAALSKASGAAAAISGVRGLGGIGKTELAYVVAHRLAAYFPDAQIIVELRGASSNPLTSEQALQTVIHAFGRETKLPDDLSQLQAIYRSVLTSKRAIILADDAKDAAQVRTLMPPPGCALLVTSRNRFSVPGMVALDLGTLPPEEAEKLLLEICPRIGEHAKDLAKLCGYLPLALRISASLLKENDSRDVARYLEQLRDERLKHLSDPDNPDDPQASVEASLRLSYDVLEPVAKRALCQISQLPSIFAFDAAKNILAVDGEIEVILERLRRHSLLDWDSNNHWYSRHDLVRDFGRERVKCVNSIRFRLARYYLPKEKWDTRRGEMIEDNCISAGVDLAIEWFFENNEKYHALELQRVSRSVWSRWGYLVNTRHFINSEAILNWASEQELDVAGLTEICRIIIRRGRKLAGV
jgi:hypothetical protein